MSAIGVLAECEESRGREESQSREEAHSQQSDSVMRVRLHVLGTPFTSLSYLT